MATGGITTSSTNNQNQYAAKNAAGRPTLRYGRRCFGR